MAVHPDDRLIDQEDPDRDPEELEYEESLVRDDPVDDSDPLVLPEDPTIQQNR